MPVSITEEAITSINESVANKLRKSAAPGKDLKIPRCNEHCQIVPTSLQGIISCLGCNTEWHLRNGVDVTVHQEPPQSEDIL